MSDTLGKPYDVVDDAKNEAIPHLYINGFAFGISNADVLIVLKLNGTSVATVNMPLTICKTLAERTTSLIGKIEAITERSFLTTDDLDVALRDLQKHD